MSKTNTNLNKGKIQVVSEPSSEDSVDISNASKEEKKEEMSEDDSVVSELGLDKVDNPRQRELLLLAKLKMLKEKVKSKNTLIGELKETLDQDEKLKKTMQNKIYDLKEKINTIKENVLKEEENKAVVNGTGSVGLVLLDAKEDENNYIHKDDDVKVLKEDEDEEFLKQAMIDKQIRGASEYMLASTAIANEHHNRIFIRKSKTCCGKFNQKLNEFLNIFTPFKGDIKHVSYRFDSNVQMYFEIHRFIFLLSLAVLVTYLYFLIAHAIKADYSQADLYCKYNIPCMLFYSRVLVSETGAFSYTYLVMTLAIFYFSLMKNIKYFRLERNSKLYDREDFRFSQFFFKSWDWSIKTRGMYVEKKKRLRSLYKMSIAEVELKEEISKRSDSDKCVRICFRILSLFLTLVIFAIYGIFIIGAYMARAALRSKSVDKTVYTAADIFNEILPPILIVIFNIAFPSLSRLLVYLEKWDFKSTERYMATIRYFVTRLFGLACIYFFNIYFVLLDINFLSLFPTFTFIGQTISTHSCPGTYSITTNSADISSSTPISRAYYSDCAEDDSAINLLLIIFADLIIRKLIDLVSFAFLYGCSNKRKIGMSYKWPFRPSKAAVDIFMLTIQLLAIVTYFPYITVLIPLILFFEFKFEMFKLVNMRSKPLKFSIEQENGSLIMILFNLSYVSIIVFNTMFYISQIPHKERIECYNNSISGNQLFYTQQLCGPYSNLIAVSYTFITAINSDSFLYFIYYVLSNPEVLIIILIFVICMILYSHDDLDTYIFYIKERENDMSNMINNLQTKIRYVTSGNKASYQDEKLKSD